MKFTCERCGKRYASTQAPAPGKVYRLRCKACGNLITLRGPEAAAPSGPPPPPAEAEAAVPAARAAAAGARPGSGATPARAATPIPGPAPAAAVERSPAAEPAPPQGGYVDLFADPDAAERAATGLVPPGSPGAPPGSAAAPEVSAAELAPASVEAAPPGSSAPLAAGPVLRAQPQRPVPSIPALSQRPGGPPLALIGAGVVVLVGILVFVLWGPGRKGPAPEPPPVAARAPAAPPAEPAPGAQAPAPPPATVAAPAVPEPSAAAPAPAAAPASAPSASPAAPAAPVASAESPAVEVRPAEAPPPVKPAPARTSAAERSAHDKERERRSRAEAAAKQRSAATKGAAAPAAKPAAAEDGGGGEEEAPPARLAKDQIDAVLQKGRPTLDACLERVRGQGLQGRTVLLSFTIRPNGEVAYPTLDDVTLSGSETGSCLKSAARGLQFPKFEGDPEHVQVPLVLP